LVHVHSLEEDGMRLLARFWLAGALACVLVVFSASAAFAAPEFGVERFFAGNCKTGFEACGEEQIKFGPFTYSLPKEPSKAEAEVGGYTQAAGHPAVGVTAFKINTIGDVPEAVPTGIVTHVRTDVAPGVSTNPEAVPKCTMAEFEGVQVAEGVFTPPTCNSETEIGVDKVVVYVPSSTPKDIPLEGKVYNLVQPNGLSSLFGVALELPEALTGHPGLVAHTFIEGHIEWATDYHDYYEVNASPSGPPLIASRLSLFGDNGTTGNGGFITNPSRCAGPGPLTTNTVTLLSSASQEAARTFVTPIGPEGCLGEGSFTAPPFEPAFKLTPETLERDQPDGITAEVILPHDPSPTGIDTSQLRTAIVTLPEGMTLNPSAANGLKACSPAQIGIKTRNPVSCPAESKIGTVTLTVPDLPATEPLEGNVYLGGGEPITNPPFTIYVDAESARYGISVRLQGTVNVDQTTGRITTEFAENPEQPFSDAKLSFNGGALAPIANPLVCGSAETETTLIPYTGTVAKSPFSDFVVGNEKGGGACPSPLPFSLGQSTQDQPTTGAANANFTLNLSRPDGHQYLSKVSTTLPEGLVGKIPAVPLCGEPQATNGDCPATSQIGSVSVAAGSGPTPAHFSGPVYLTGPYAGAPYGMTIVVNAAVGPFSLGSVITRATIDVNPFTARVTVTSQLPTIFKGIPLRLKSLSVAVNRQGFLINPTNCGALSTDTLLTSTFGSTQLISTPFQASGCSALPFKPRLRAKTNAKASRRNGVSFETSIGYPLGRQANIKSVKVQLPKQLPSRLSTLKLACVEATFKANPSACPAGSRVGGATAVTPVLPKPLTGQAFFVSHGGAAFPDLDLVMSGNGVTIVLVGNTSIVKGITTTTFASVPDVPVSSFHLKLPAGKFSALAGRGNLCRSPLIMPTTITAQNGAVLKQRIRIAVAGCGVQILSHRVRRHRAILKIKAFSAGRLTVGGRDLRIVHRNLRKAGAVKVSVPLSRAGLRALANAHRHRHHLKLRVRVRFVPRKGHASFASTRVVFR
jgi:hypothetical protein